MEFAALVRPEGASDLEDFFESCGKQPFHVKFGAGGKKTAGIGPDRPDVNLGGRSACENGCLDFQETLGLRKKPESVEEPGSAFRRKRLLPERTSFSSFPSALDALHILAGPRIDPHAFAFFDEKRDLDDMAGTRGWPVWLPLMPYRP